jgi:hypothetical protein
MHSVEVIKQLLDYPIPDCRPLVDWFLMEYLSDYSIDVSVVYTDLSEENVTGWCERLSDYQFLIEIDYRLEGSEHSKTILHELTHCLQHLKGIPRCEICANLSEQQNLDKYSNSL